ncbi:MAG: 4-(cytidine 5'-diphospho)-2-C-methyl-D-erythritol kinase [Candidatus Omnitrophota bacterium]
MLTLKSPAKVNLFLHVRFKRKDGYHEIHTLFERLSLADELVFTRARSGIRLETHAKGLPRGPQNLVYKAAKLLKDKFHVPEGVRIRLRKRIPVGAGLGGGSSNAAATLLGLNQLWRLGLSRKTLLGMAAGLGSDVPFFILETPFAVGSGRGEILKKMGAPSLKIWHCVVKPPLSISTKEAYLNLRASRLTPKKANAKMLLRSFQEGNASRFSQLLQNSLETALNKRVTTILEIKKKLLSQGALGSLMSGSGSAVFGIFKSRRKARKAARFLRKADKRWQVFVASTI